ncbi:PAS domain S-box protein [Halorubrum salinum]|uniref:PAS domain S-box protein n=1 Tax=Halorubrum salinum TaxID=767517 RepID=UPI0021127123|nr:PAS domain S-box protein [Halorubrum salinum]
MSEPGSPATNPEENHQVRREIFERMSDGVVALDDTLRITFVNSSATTLLDADAESLLGEDICDVFQNQRDRTVRDTIEQAIETGELASFDCSPQRAGQWCKVRIHPGDEGVTIVLSDITEDRHKAEQADTLFNNTQDGLFVIAVENAGETFRVKRVNPAYETVTGTSAVELQGKTVREITGKADSAHVREKYKECVSGQQPVQYKEYLSTFDGGSWWETRIAPVLVNGTVSHIVGSTRNITEQKQREQRLQKFEQMVEHTGHAVFFTDADGQIEYVNPEFEDLTGYTAVEVLGKKPGFLNSGEHDDAFFADLWDTVLDGEVWSGEIVNKRKDGAHFVANHTIAPVTDDSGDVTHFVAIYNDITGRKRRETELRQKTRALENAPVGITLTDPSQEDNPMTYVNKRFSEVTGYEKEDSIGRNCRFLQGERTDPDQIETIRDAVNEVESTETTLLNYRKDGTKFWNQLSISPVKDENGELETFVGFQKDITDKKEREQRLETYELVVQAMNEVAYLVDDNKRIQFANDAALEFAGVSHEAMKGRQIGPVTKSMAAPDEDPTRFINVIDSLLEDDKPDVGEWIQEPDGTETLSLGFGLELDSVGKIYTEQRFVPVELYDGERGVAVISRDITHQQEREQEIQTHLVQAQEVGHVGSWFLEIETSDLQWSDECYRIFGLEPGTAMTYERFLTIVHPDDRDKVTEAWDDALENGGYDIEHRIVVEGETRWVREIAEVEFDADGDPESGIGVVRDITEQVQRTHEVRAQKRRYESLFKNVSGAVVVTDTAGNITTCNPGFTDLFGYDIDEIEGDHLRTITDNGADIERVLEATAVPNKPKIINYQKNTGHVFSGESRGSPLRTHDGDIDGYVVHIIDISEEQENREHLQVLGRIFRHNVRNNMNVIMGAAQRIREHGSDTVTPWAEKILEKSQTFVEMGENQQRITKLLTRKRETEDIDVVPILKEVVSGVQKHYPDATLNVDLATGGQANTVREIDAAIRELVQNAIIHSEQTRPRVDIRHRYTDAITEITIRDNGPGIPEQEWSVLTADGEINSLNHGTGLGLWFVNHVVRRSNGTLSFDTNELGGTTVRIRLPTSMSHAKQAGDC